MTWKSNDKSNRFDVDLGFFSERSDDNYQRRESSLSLDKNLLYVVVYLCCSLRCYYHSNALVNDLRMGLPLW